MKLAISPTYIFSAIVGLSFVSLSSISNPGYGRIDGNWVIWIGCTVFTLALTRMHAAGEAKRNIPRSRKWIRVVYRGIILLALGFIAYRYEISNDNMMPAAMLSLNQAFLFGVFFDLWYNEFRGNRWDYHGDNSWYDQKAKINPQAFLIAEIFGYIITSILVCSGVFL